MIVTGGNRTNCLSQSPLQDSHELAWDRNGAPTVRVCHGTAVVACTGVRHILVGITFEEGNYICRDEHGTL